VATVQSGTYLARGQIGTAKNTSELHEFWCAIPGLNQWQTATRLRANRVAVRRIQFPVLAGCFHLEIDEAAGQAGNSGQLAAFIQQRIRDGYRRQRTTPLPSRTAKSRH
jgi:hypothetical protein